MDDRAYHWTQAEKLLALAATAKPGTGSDAIAAAHVHAILATAKRMPMDDVFAALDRAPGEALGVLAARTAETARRVASTAREIAEDATAATGGPPALGVTATALARASDYLAEAAGALAGLLAPPL